MPVLNSPPKLYAFEAQADHEGNPGKFTLKLTYRAYYQTQLVEVVIVKDQLFEDDSIDPDFWIDVVANDVTPAYTALGYTNS